MPPPSLDDDFLDRVRRSYRLGIVLGERAGYIWQLIDERRADVHAALMSATNDGLRRVFANPATTDLFYGIDELCRSRPPQQIDGSIVDHLLANHRGTLAAYQVHRVLELLDVRQGASLIEIGPGMGRVTYHAFRAGLDCSTIDLPLGVVAQACFLGQALGPGALWFYGEDEHLARGRIKLLFTGGKPEQRFDVALNTNSITEMSFQGAFDCLYWLADHAQIFISINHEKNVFTLAEVATFAGIGKPVI